MKRDRDKPGRDGRRSFLKDAGATLAYAGVAAAPSPAVAQGPSQPPAGTPAPGTAGAPGYQSLSLEEAATTEALVEHMWPADQFTVSGVELGIELAGAFGRGDRLYLQAPFRKGKAQHGYQLPLTPEAWYKTLK